MFSQEFTTTYTMPVARPSHFAMQKMRTAHLVLVNSSGAVDIENLYAVKGRIILGRKSSADITLADEKLSRHHAQIYNDGKHYYIKDLNSTNGTKVNGKAITEKRIKPKDIIEMGDLKFEFNYPRIVPKRNQKSPKNKISTYIKICKGVLLASIATLCAFLIYYSATKPFSVDKRSPQSLTKKAEKLSENWSTLQAQLYYKMSAQAFGEGDYQQAKRHLEQAKYLNLHDARFDVLKKAIREALVLKQVYVDKLQAKQNKHKIEKELNFYFEAAQRLIDHKQWDRAIIAYQEALMLDAESEQAKRGISNIEHLRSLEGRKVTAVEKETKSVSAVVLFQKINHLVAEGQELANHEKYAQAIKIYKKALTLAKKHQFNAENIINPLTSAIGLLKSGTQSNWKTAQTLFDAQKYVEAKQTVEKILHMNPYFKPAIDQKSQLDKLLSKQVRTLFSKALVYENMSDISAAKSKWGQILTLVSAQHPYYIKAQSKLTHYVSF